MALTSLERTSDQPLYEQVAHRIAQMIHAQALRPGDRVPSVRRLHRQMSVSISTVLEAYRLLEAWRLIEARPQSGYFVRPYAPVTPPEPGPSAPSGQACHVDVRSLALRLTQAAGRDDVIKLGAAVPSPKLLPTQRLNRLLSQVVRREPDLAHTYDAPPGCKKLREQVARRMLDAGCTISPHDILTTTGATEAMCLALQATTTRGDSVAIESPCYFGILETLEALGVRALELPTHPREGIDLRALEEAMANKRVKAVALSANFSNPLGGLMPDSHKKRIAQLAQQYDIPVIEDDCYGDLPFDTQRPKAIKAFDRSGHVIYCATVSKTLSPGLRVGWCAPGRWMERVEQLKLATSHGSAVAPQLAVAAFLASGGYDRHLRKLRRTYLDHVRLVSAAVARYFPQGTRMTRPAGGHLLWIELPEMDSIELHEAAIARNISIAPGPLFSPTGRYRNCLRLNCAIPWSDEVERAIATLGELAKQNTRSTEN